MNTANVDGEMKLSGSEEVGEMGRREVGGRGRVVEEGWWSRGGVGVVEKVMA